MEHFLSPLPNLPQRCGMTLNQVSTPKVKVTAELCEKIIVRIIHVYYLLFVQSDPYSISSEPLFSEFAVTLNKFSFKVKSQVLKLVKYPCLEYVYFLPCFWVEQAVTLIRTFMSMVRVYLKSSFKPKFLSI